MPNDNPSFDVFKRQREQVYDVVELAWDWNNPDKLTTKIRIARGKALEKKRRADAKHLARRNGEQA